MASPNLKQDISVIIPIFNEENSLVSLCEKLGTFLDRYSEKSEVIFIDDGSTDSSSSIIKSFAFSDKRVKVHTFHFNQGQCRALQKGFELAKSDIIVSLDGDMTIDPVEICKLTNKLNEDFDVVCAWRYPRKDPWHKVIRFLVGNFLQRLLTGIPLHDMSSTTRAYKQHVIKKISLENEYDLFLIPLILSKKTNKITEIKIKHLMRSCGKSKYRFFPTCVGVIKRFLKIRKKMK